MSYYTIDEFCIEYPMGRSSFYRLVKAKKIRLTKFGRSSRVAKSDAKEWAKSLPTIGSENFAEAE